MTFITAHWALILSIVHVTVSSTLGLIN